MPSSHPQGRRELASVTEFKGLSRGRTRYCKKCKFSCTDAREFTLHLSSHSDSQNKLDSHTDTHLKSLRSKRNSRSAFIDIQSSKAADMEVTSEHLSPGAPIGQEKDKAEASLDKMETENKQNDDDHGDEPDAMSYDIKAKCQPFHSGKLDSSAPDDISGVDDVEDEGRLVIDDHVQSGTKSNHAFSSSQFSLAETDARKYIHPQEVKKDYKCDQCDYGTSSRSKLARHKELHEASKSRQLEMVSPYQQLSLKRETDEDNFLNVSTDALETSSFINDMENGEDDMADTPNGSGLPLTITPENIDQVLDDDKKKKKKTRQEVDPGKYFEAVDSSGTKYACSQCGNIYKWRKSLNKHWKEKHSLDPLVEVASPPGMLELLKSGKYTQLGARRIYDNIFLSTIKTQKDDDHVQATASPSSIPPSPSPPNFLSNSQSLVNNRMSSNLSSLMPKMIGPFVAPTSQPVFPGMSHSLSNVHNGYESTDEFALDLSRDMKVDSLQNSPYSISPFDQDQPLDFSKKKETTSSAKHDKLWDEFRDLKPSQGINQYIAKVHRCTKCEYTSNSEADFANHTSSHLNKRIVKCNQCKIQISSMDELNNHFLKLHFKKLTEHKEAIKKIPHGLQQTYHLLKMDLQDIGELNNQDLGASDSKSLKCKKCEFEAKWPAELQKHAVSHSEERPYVCMVCGSTYKWKWDLVKHFQKSHPNLPNPYRRNDKRDSPDGSSEEENEDEPEIKKTKLNPDLLNKNQLNRDDVISVEGIMAATQAGQRVVSSHLNILDDEPNNLDKNISFFGHFKFNSGQGTQLPQTAQDLIDSQHKAQRAMQEASRNRQGLSSNKKIMPRDQASPTPSGSKTEELPYKCTMCNYHARWPSEVTQHMKNHSDSKPYLCPRCEYRSKWKWDVVKHLKRCGGGGINDVIDTTKNRKREAMQNSQGPPNAIVCQQGKIRKVTSQSGLSYMLDDNGQQQPTPSQTSGQSSGDDLSRSSSNASTLDLSNNNDSTHVDSNTTNNNYAAYTNGQPFAGLSMLTTVSNVGNGNVSSSPSQSPPATKVVSSRNNDNIWNCPHCPFTTASQAELKRHSGLHSDDKPFKCDVCQYSTRWACDLKKHRKSYDHYPPINREEKSVEKTLGRFRCSHCSLYFQSLQNLLEHRMAEHIGREGVQASPVPQEPAEIDAARIKHPRKPIKQLQCNKCAFVCKNRQTMEKHKEEHEQLDSSGYQCFYCSSQFKEKESLLDHMSTHSAFNPKEWETFFMINEDEDHQHIKEEAKTNDPQDKETSNQPVDMEHVVQESKPENSLSSTEARIQQILNEIPKQAAKQLQFSQQTNKYQCEWCPAEFINLTAVYKHASQAHPIQLKEQDVSLSLAAQKASAASKKIYTGESLEILKRQIAEKRNQQLVEKLNEIITNKPEVQEVLSKKMEEGSKRYNCDKCNFSSANILTFQRHHDLHGSKSASQCWFCDYSVDRMNLLYQHMKISHTRKWKALSQDPKYAEQIQKMNHTFTNLPIQGNNNDSPPEASSADVCAMDLSSKNNNEVTHDVVYITRQQYTWSGIPVNVIPVDNALNFVCPHCAFNDASIAKTCAHVMQSHRAMAKFTCKKCQFSDDNIHVMSDHCKISHPINERIVEVLSFKQLNFSELQMVQMAAIKEKQEMIATAQEEMSKTMACPFCPFKTLVTEQMKCHLSSHSQQARYRCQLCDFSSDSTTIISDHVRVHDKNYNFDSKINSLPGKDEISNSKILETKSEPMDTDLSETPLSNKDKVSSPKSKTNGRIRYRCLACPFYTSCKSNILKHKRQHLHNKRYKCSICSYSSARAVLLRKHLASHDTTIEDDGLHHDIFYDPNSVEDLKPDEVDEQDEDLDEDEFEDDETNSEDLDEMDAKAIADLEAKDILEAEAAHKNNSQIEDDLCGDSSDKQFRRQKCTVCPFSSNSSYEFRKHLNFHGTQERYKCDYCSYSLDRLNLLSQHRKLHSLEPNFNPNPPAADLLNTDFIYKQNQLEELGEAVEEDKNDVLLKQYACPYCAYKTCKKKSFDIHCNSHGLRRRYICDFCDWSADRLALLCQHRKVHEGEPNFDAGPEDKVFLNQEFDDGAAGEFEAKLMEIKNQDKTKKDGETDALISPPFKLTVVKKIYPCKLCPYKSNSGNSFAVHTSMHDSGAEYRCTKCSYAAHNKGLLQQHMHLHSLDCADIKDIAGPEAPSESPHLVEPMVGEKEQNGSESFLGIELTCQRCPFTALSPSVLKEHAKCHMAHDSITCPYCDFSTMSKQLLYPHIQVHFPGTKLSQESLELALESRGKIALGVNCIVNNNNNSEPALPKCDKPTEDAVKTQRVYVCQYCEREFEAKQLMIQHEKQHLGSH
ncbi:zinc finger protein Xfin [Biomphalaria glabrata]|nr:zinc finger protein Xfin [Biomphalaria glabrata]